MILTVFDLDGTLADTLFDLADAVNYGLEKLGYPVHPYESYKLFVGNGVQKLCERALPDGKKDETDKLAGLFSEYYNVHFLDKTRLYDGVREALEALRDKGAVFAVATNKPENFAVKIVERLLPEFEFVKVLGGCDRRPKKPDTAILREIFDGLPEGTVNAFMIGDSAVDIMTGHGVGIKAIGCIWGFRGREELAAAGADYIAESPLDIVKIIFDRTK